MVKKSKKMIIPEKTFDSNESFQDFIEQEKKWMHDRIFECIKEAFAAGNQIAYVMDAKIEDTMSVISINSDRSEWVMSLKLISDWYLSQEMYEKCAEIRDLISSIESAEL